MDILPQLDNTALYNQWDKHRLYYSRSVNYGITNNYTIASTWISCLGCPDDDSLEPGQGNLSYVVNGGFSRWPGHTVWNAETGRLEGVFPPGLTGSLQGVALGYGKPLDWGSDIARRTGVMFLGTAQGNTPWDVKTTPSDIPDGMSTTVLLSENTLAGYAPAGKNPYSGGLETNWAAPLPNSVMFFGSDDVCGGPFHNSPGSGRCQEDKGLRPVPKGATFETGPSWADANRYRSFEGINASTCYGIVTEGGFPYPSSGYPGGVCVAMCDGSVHFVRDTIDGTVWARLLTPAGSLLRIGPNGEGGDFRQGSLTQADLEP